MRLYPHYSFLIDVLAPCPRWLQGFRPALITGREQVAIKEGKNMMRQSRTGAWIFSGAVLLAAAGFASYALGTQKTPGGNGYELSARFVSANGLTRGADVELAGVRVGRVSSITLDPASQMALVRFRLASSLRLPQDSTLSIGSATLASENALMIEPGHDNTYAPPGALLTHTQEPTSLEQQVSNYIFGSGNLGP
ncbi:MlaD family protein [Acetobacter papayae]|uniref:MlaD family protein n=1 Tax=Acetobacter papayae TaxID=1076592 RepID=UPI0039E9F46A